MMQKVKDALQQRDDMTTQMEEAFTAKQAVSTVTHLLLCAWFSGGQCPWIPVVPPQCISEDL